MPAYPASTSSCCSQTCPDPVVVNIPGPQGLAGSDGSTGSNGTDAFSFLTSGFAMPAELGTVTAVVTTTAWMAVGQIVFIPVAGYMRVNTIIDGQHVSLVNLEDTPNAAYSGNAAPTTAIANGSIVTPGGVQGPAPGGSGTGAIIGVGSPEGAQLANPGQAYLDVTNPAAPSLWYKTSGVGTKTGWVQLIA